MILFLSCFHSLWKAIWIPIFLSHCSLEFGIQDSGTQVHTIQFIIVKADIRTFEITITVWRWSNSIDDKLSHLINLSTIWPKFPNFNTKSRKITSDHNWRKTKLINELKIRKSVAESPNEHCSVLCIYSSVWVSVSFLVSSCAPLFLGTVDFKYFCVNKAAFLPPIADISIALAARSIAFT